MNKQIDPLAIHALLIERATDLNNATLVTPPPTERFLSTARTAAQRGADLRKLDATARSRGFQPLPLPDYLAWVAQDSGVGLTRLSPPPPKGESPSSAWIGLAKSIGMPIQRIRLLLRLWVAQCCAEAATSSVLARNALENAKATQQTPYEGLTEIEVESMLDDVEAQYPPEASTRLSICLAELE